MLQENLKAHQRISRVERDFYNVSSRFSGFLPLLVKQSGQLHFIAGLELDFFGICGAIIVISILLVYLKDFDEMGKWKLCHTDAASQSF